MEAGLSIGFALIALVYWGSQARVLRRVAARMPLLETLPLEDRAHWPRVSAILTACNEEKSLEPAVRARLADDYPDLEIILVDDRSTDATAQIADRLAAQDHRIRVEHITSLPADWLGKVHAMQRGLSRAGGEWILFSDGDVSVHPGALKRIIAYCERKGYEHCVMLPKLRPVHPLLDCLTSAFMRLVALHLRIWDIEDPRSPLGVGVGAFNLVKRSALERTPGLEWLRREVGDDLALGQMLKASGARQTVVNGRSLMSITFHASLRDAFRSAERATYTSIGNFSLARLAGMAAALLVMEISPLVSLLFARTPLTLALALSALAAAFIAMRTANRIWARSSGHLWFYPAAVVLACYSILRSGILGKYRGGIVWRGTFYGNAWLKEGRRYGQAWKTFEHLRKIPSGLRLEPISDGKRK